MFFLGRADCPAFHQPKGRLNRRPFGALSFTEVVI